MRSAMGGSRPASAFSADVRESLDQGRVNDTESLPRILFFAGRKKGRKLVVAFKTKRTLAAAIYCEYAPHYVRRNPTQYNKAV
jgi:hypothetical protein